MTSGNRSFDDHTANGLVWSALHQVSGVCRSCTMLQFLVFTTWFKPETCQHPHLLAGHNCPPNRRSGPHILVLQQQWPHEWYKRMRQQRRLTYSYSHTSTRVWGHKHIELAASRDCRPPPLRRQRCTAACAASRHAERCSSANILKMQRRQSGASCAVKHGIWPAGHQIRRCSTPAEQTQFSMVDGPMDQHIVMGVPGAVNHVQHLGICSSATPWAASCTTSIKVRCTRHP